MSTNTEVGRFVELASRWFTKGRGLQAEVDEMQNLGKKIYAEKNPPLYWFQHPNNGKFRPVYAGDEPKFFVSQGNFFFGWPAYNVHMLEFGVWLLYQQLPAHAVVATEFYK